MINFFECELLYSPFTKDFYLADIFFWSFDDMKIIHNVPWRRWLSYHQPSLSSVSTDSVSLMFETLSAVVALLNGSNFKWKTVVDTSSDHFSIFSYSFIQCFMGWVANAANKPSRIQKVEFCCLQWTDWYKCYNVPI